MQILQQAQDILRPGTADKAAQDPGSIFNRQRLASMVGVAAILLSVVLFVSTFFGSAFYQSISHFYYSKYLGPEFQREVQRFQANVNLTSLPRF